ncbi:hypothetical protein ACWC6I_24440 [Streptomyces sp. NPDC001414]|uniref:hypothetical protein n=1 Tax=Actinacidiphila yeochonensis TaxID=89050 RepID=UPI00055BACEC|nr:hypothetical protein [Actinacidiphila yeochonensis]
MIFRKLDPPLGPDGRPDYGLPAAVLAALAALTLAIAAMYAALASRFLHDHPRWASTAIVAAAVLPGTGIFLLARRLLARHGLYLWQSWAAAAVATTLMYATPGWAYGIFPRVDDRYERELGGPGHCLHDTPYDLKRARTTYAGDHPGRMVVEPLHSGLPALQLDNAVNGGLRHLTPADAAARRILAQHNC